MNAPRIIRTSYRTASGTPRQGLTSLDESSIDLHGYQQPLERAHGGALHGRGVGQGLDVTVTIGQPDARVGTGIALDVLGRHISLAEGGLALIGPEAVVVTADGVLVRTAGLTGVQYLTIAWAETFDRDSNEENEAVFRVDHTPRLALVGGPPDETHVVLARLELDADGAVTTIDSSDRRSASLTAGALRVRRATGGGSSPGSDETVSDRLAGGLLPRPAGGLLLHATDHGDVIEIGREGGSVSRLSLVADRIVARLGIGRNALAVDVAHGRLAVGPLDGPPARVVHTEGSEIHSGGGSGGLSFADRDAGSFVEAPTRGERWVWYSVAGTARLWSGRDLLTINPAGTLTVQGALTTGGDAVVKGWLTTRHVRGKQITNDGPGELLLNADSQWPVIVGANLYVRGDINWSGDRAGQRYLRLGTVQLCWGEYVLANRQGESQVFIRFPQTFAEPPVVTGSLDDTGYGFDRNLAGVGVWTVATDGFTALYKSGSNAPGPVRYRWMAVGRCRI